MLDSKLTCFTGLVKGKENVGSAPIEGVEITWSFVDFPEVNGTAITNSDGLFVDSVTGEIGLNIQVCNINSLVSYFLLFEENNCSCFLMHSIFHGISTTVKYL